MLRLIKIFNRPLSPHLTIYSGQFTSVFSIWHRITGIILIVFLVNFLFFFKILSYKIFVLSDTSLLLNLTISTWVKNTLFINLIIFLGYHTLNGIRHIIWDLGYALPISIIKNSVKIITVFLIITISVLVYKIVN